MAMQPFQGVSMRFCRECNNILHPKEDKEHKELLYACRHCDHQEEADNACVYKNIIKVDVEDQLMFNDDVISDPTLMIYRNKQCKQCGVVGNQVVWQHPSVRDDEGLIVYFICSNSSCRFRERVRA